MLRNYLTTKQAAERCSLTNHHIRRLLEHGTIRGMKVGRDWLVLISSLDSYMANRPKPGRKSSKKVGRDGD